MLVVRRAQLEAFARIRRQEFAREASVWFAEEFPDEAARLGPDGVSKTLEDAVEDAAANGMREKEQVLQFVRWRQEFGDAFAQLPWAAEALANDRYDASLKLALLARGAEAARNGELDAE